jgi:hypothetical protein
MYQGQAEVELRIVVDGVIYIMDMCDYSEYIENLIKEGDIKDDIDEIVKCVADSHGIKPLND